MENKKETVCAVVVTYNRKKLLLECLEAIRKQTRPVQGIYLIDNASADGTPKLLLEKGYIKELPPENLTEPWEEEFEIKNLTDGEVIKLHYVRMHENTGGAGGFHEGVKRAYKKGYDWLWLMDDDVKPLKEGLKTMLKYKSVADCIHPSWQYLNNTKFNWEARYFPIKKSKKVAQQGLSFKVINYGCFEGMLIHRKLVKKIGFPDPKFFIRFDDTIYGFLASKAGRNIYIDEVCFIKMRMPLKVKSRFLWLTSIRTVENEIRLYYEIRNRFLIIKYLKQYNVFSKCGYLHTVVYLLRRFLGIILFDKNKFKKIQYFFRGLIDGIQGNYGKCEFCK